MLRFAAYSNELSGLCCDSTQVALPSSRELKALEDETPSSRSSRRRRGARQRHAQGCCFEKMVTLAAKREAVADL
jgi:hypothetical protein